MKRDRTNIDSKCSSQTGDLTCSSLPFSVSLSPSTTPCREKKYFFTPDDNSTYPSYCPYYHLDSDDAYHSSPQSNTYGNSDACDGKWLIVIYLMMVFLGLSRKGVFADNVESLLVTTTLSEH
eukprot:6285903-Ditylum_brightwellii.AAC.1